MKKYIILIFLIFLFGCVGEWKTIAQPPQIGELAPSSIGYLDTPQGSDNNVGYYNVSFSLVDPNSNSAPSAGELRITIDDDKNNQLYNSGQLSINKNDFVEQDNSPFYGDSAFTKKISFSDIRKTTSYYATVNVTFVSDSGTVIEKTTNIFLPADLIQVHQNQNDNTPQYDIVTLESFNISEPFSSITLNRYNGNYSMYDNGLLRMYNFDNQADLGESGKTAVDLSKNHNKAILNGVSYTDGIYGSSLYFEGPKSYVDLGAPNYYSNNEFTAEMWLNLRSWNNQMLAISGNAWQDTGFYLNIYDSRLYITIPNKSGGWQAYTWQQPFQLGMWTHIAVTVKTNNELKLYINGVRSDTVTSIPEKISTPSTNLLLGYYPTQQLNGEIDEFRLWNRSLSADEIMTHYLSNLQKVDQNNWVLTYKQPYSEQGQSDSYSKN